MNINGYVPFLILVYILPMNINVYVPFLILVYTLPININGYVPFLILLYTQPMNINGYLPFFMYIFDTCEEGDYISSIFPGVWGAPIRGVPKVFLYFVGLVWAAPQHPNPLLKRPCAVLVWWLLREKISHLPLAVVFHSVEAAWCRCRRSPVLTLRGWPFSNLRGPSHQTLTQIEGLGLSLCTLGLNFRELSTGPEVFLEPSTDLRLASS